MKMIKLLHAADLHLDSPFEGLPDGKAAQRRSEQRSLLRKIAQIAEVEQVQLVLLAGDLFDSDITYAETAETLVRTLGEMRVPVFISPGNHDYFSSRSPYAKLKFPDNVHIFSSGELECVELPTLGARVWGAAFTDKYAPCLINGVRAQKSDDTLDIMCIHGEVNASSQYNPMTEQQLAQSGMDYVALGHIHKGSGLKRAGGTWYAWPGCPEGRGFDETGDKEVYIVGIIDDECRIKPIKTSQRKYEILNVELDGKNALEAIKDRLDDKTESDIYRIILRGESSEAPDISNLQRTLEGRFYSLQLRDETRVHRDIWYGAGEDTLRGQFLARLKDAFENAHDEAEREKITQAVRWGLAALEKREEVVRHDD